MGKTEAILEQLEKNGGYLRTAEALAVGVSKAYLQEFVLKHGLERAAHGLYMSADAWPDGLFVLQTRYPKIVFSHETALYLLGMAEREPLRIALTQPSTVRGVTLKNEGHKVYYIKPELFELGLTQAQTPFGHTVRCYDAERTICDLLRSRRTVNAQEMQAGVRAYVAASEKNIPKLMRYAAAMSCENAVRQYLEVLF
jgi:predicted transcriptional regulator of viral defense system